MLGFASGLIYCIFFCTTIYYNGHVAKKSHILSTNERQIMEAMNQTTTTNVISESLAPSAVCSARSAAVRVSIELDGLNRVAHAANRVYAEKFAEWAFEVAPKVMWFNMTFEQLKSNSKTLGSEAKVFRSEYKTSNISKVWADIKTYAAEYVKKTPNMCELYYGVSEIVEVDTEADGGEGNTNAPRTADEVIQSSKKNGGVWLYRNLVKRDSLSPDAEVFMHSLRDALLTFGVSESDLSGEKS
jgi:hypothetical protein